MKTGKQLNATEFSKIEELTIQLVSDRSPKTSTMHNAGNDKMKTKGRALKNGGTELRVSQASQTVEKWPQPSFDCTT